MRLNHYINGGFIGAENGALLDVINPATGELIHELEIADSAMVDAAVQSARAAFNSWSQLAAEDRSRFLQKIAEGIENKFEAFALAESTDTGKPIALTRRMDIPRAIQNFRFFSHAATQFASESHDSAFNHTINYTLRQALGAVACISPWNLPLYLFSWKIAPALAAGNTVVAKPSEVTPYTAYLLAEVCIEAGLPEGVLNIVQGDGQTTGNALIQHDGIKAVSFTGSTKVGAHIAQSCAAKFKKASLELGGKNPILIFDDCNYEKMLDTVVRSSFTNQGQICLCGSRLYIQESLYEKFKVDFIKRTEQLKVGNPLEQDTNIGAVVSRQHYEKILSHIELAKLEGGQILTGGFSLQPRGFEKGFYIAPTIIEGLSNQCRTNQEEIFGPVVSIMPFHSQQEALNLANESRYGLACSLWTENLSRAHAMAKEINTGIVWINTWLNRDLRTPFGGMNDSGMGREGGMEAMRFFTEPKNVCIQYQ